MSGLSDEAGASAPLAMAIKQVGAPDQFEIDRIEEFIEHTVWQARHYPIALSLPPRLSIGNAPGRQRSTSFIC